MDIQTLVFTLARRRQELRAIEQRIARENVQLEKVRGEIADLVGALHRRDPDFSERVS